MEGRTKKIIIISVIVIAVLVVIFFFIKRKAKTQAAVVADNINTTVFPLKKGSKGTEVKQMQTYIQNQYGTSKAPEKPNVFPLYGIDGDWGDETDAAVQKYLKRSSVSLDFYTKTDMASQVLQ